MMTINRHFNIEKIKKALGYKALVPSEKAWEITCNDIKKKREELELAKFKSGKLQPILYFSTVEVILNLLFILYILFFCFSKLNFL